MEQSSVVNDVLMTESFIDANYLFRHNVISDKIEVKKLGEDGYDFTAFSSAVFNTIVRELRLLGVDGANTHVREYVYSLSTPEYNPIDEYLDGLPEWDGKDRVVPLLQRIPGITAEHVYLLSIWLRSMVAHWRQMDMLHGNECVFTLIGSQGCGKSTFFMRLLPESLREYFLDHFNPSNKFDREMALSNNLIVNLDELDAIRPSQHALLKQALSKVQVNSRKIYRSEQTVRKRFASFVATTNTQAPLTDPTGSRRYICVKVADGQLIDNDSALEREQLFAQICHELGEGKRYWFTNDETKQIQSLNAPYEQVGSLRDMIACCFRHPRSEELPTMMNVVDMVAMMKRRFPNASDLELSTVKLGCALRAMDFEKCRNKNGTFYNVKLAS